MSRSDPTMCNHEQSSIAWIPSPRLSCTSLDGRSVPLAPILPVRRKSPGSAKKRADPGYLTEPIRNLLPLVAIIHHPQQLEISDWIEPLGQLNSSLLQLRHILHGIRGVSQEVDASANGFTL
jgi:hypothetical protein